MSAVLIKNGTAYPCHPFAAVDNNGFTEIACQIRPHRIGSVAYAPGVVVWVLPSEIHAAETVKQRRDRCDVRHNTASRLAFLAALPKPLKTGVV